MNEFKQQMDEVGLATFAGSDLLRSFESIRAFGEEFAGGARVREETERFERGEQRATMKQFLIKYQEQQQFTQEHPLFVCGLELLPAAFQTLGPCKFISADLWYSIPNNSTQQRVWSQNWHRDPEDANVLKVMLFLRDVDSESGPFEYIAGSHKAYYEYCKPKSYLHPSMYACLEGARVLSVECPAGTLVFANTSGLHRGGYTKSKPRLCCVWTYVPKESDCHVKFSLN